VRNGGVGGRNQQFPPPAPSHCGQDIPLSAGTDGMMATVPPPERSSMAAPSLGQAIRQGTARGAEAVSGALSTFNAFLFLTV